jgi:hypothetical protein
MAVETAGDARTMTRQLIEMIMGFRVTQLIYVAAKLEIADLLASGPQSSTALAKASGADERSLYRLLRALASLGIFAELEEARFALTPLAQLLRKGVPGSMHGIALLYGDPVLWQAYGALLDVVQSGKTAFDTIHGVSFFTYLSEHPEVAQVFQEAMTSFSAPQINGILAAYDFGDARHVVDIGGGEGALLIAILERYPALQGTLFDLPATIERVRQRQAARSKDEAGAWARCTLAAGDFFQSVSPGGDLYLLKQVIHDWQDEQCITILRNCHTAMAGRGKLLVLERVIVPEGKGSEAKLFDINMMVTAGGQQRSHAEFAALLAAAGFRLTQLIPTESPLTIVEAAPL